MLSHESRGDIRFDWFEANVRECQMFVERAILDREPVNVTPLAETLASALSNPDSAAEDMLLRGLLLEVAAKWGTSIHRRAHAADDGRCDFVPERTLGQFWISERRGAKRGFLGWSRTYAAEFARAHASSIAQRAARLVRDGYARWDNAQAARSLFVAPAHLAREFRRAYGLSLPEYVRRVRLLHALERIATSHDKIEPISLEVGYRSKKNFYHALRQLTGMAPLEFRRLPPDAAQRLIDSIKRALITC